ncbi:5-formyltetrahydrofolate cyclo-ligase [Nitrosophilus alvini]|uniref:5-formyltetrahydrofolate cyclo-ligase n=1 Tax=Nitrosophilus alvini TaxID=2714855 RepID=UPI00190994C2|nr:5-formyltetrahydrofolate cyclo-ligase [Nitrosophilus alvini]
MNQKSKKEIYRQKCIEKLKKNRGVKKRKLDKELNKRLSSIIDKINPQSLLLYTPLSFEPDITEIFKRYRGKKTIFVPFMEGKSFKMVKYRLPLHKKRFGIKEPSNSFFGLAKIDLAVVPVIGVDRDFRRLGFGKGMYDRFFAKLNYRPVVIFVQIKKCFIDEKITDIYDVKGDFLITPFEIKKIGDRNVVRNTGGKLCSHYWRCSRLFDSKKSGKKQI